MDFTWPGANATLSYSLFLSRPLKTPSKKRKCVAAVYWTDKYMKWGSRPCSEKLCGVCQTIDS